MSVAQEVPAKKETPGMTPPRQNGRWSGYRHLLMARMLELKREPEVVFWVFIFPLCWRWDWELPSGTSR